MGECFMKRSLLFAPLLTLCFAITMSATAQQLPERGVRPAMEKFAEEWDAAANKRDASAAAAMYTEDAMRVTPEGFEYGRAAIEKGLAAAFKVISNSASKVEKVQVVGEIVLVTGSWSHTVQTQNGPVQARGFWGDTFVRDGDAWKASLAVVNTHMTLPPQ